MFIIAYFVWIYKRFFPDLFEQFINLLPVRIIQRAILPHFPKSRHDIVSYAQKSPRMTGRRYCYLGGAMIY